MNNKSIKFYKKNRIINNSTSKSIRKFKIPVKKMFDVCDEVEIIKVVQSQDVVFLFERKMSEFGKF